MTAREIAAGIRKTHLLTVALAATAGKEGDLREACGLAEDAIEAAIAAAERRGIERAAEVARENRDRWLGDDEHWGDAARVIEAAILALAPEGDGWLTERAAAGLSEAVIEGNNIVIRVPVSTLPIAFEHWPDAPRDAEGDPLYRVTDAATFAKGVARYLNDESEDGTTRIHRMLDDAMNEALEQGEEGVEEIASPPKATE